MLDVVRSAARQNGARAGFDVEILSLATASPPFQLSQAEAAAREGKARHGGILVIGAEDEALDLVTNEGAGLGG